MHVTISSVKFFPPFVMIACCKLNIVEKFVSCFFTVNWWLTIRSQVFIVIWGMLSGGERSRTG